MKVAVIGSGGREHELARKIGQSPLVGEVLCIPGNDPMGLLPKARCFPDIAASNIQGILKLALQKEIDLTIIGPEAPLVDGIVDIFEEAKLFAFGPKKAAAVLEGSKAWAKRFMFRHKIKTAPCKILDSTSSVREYLDSYIKTGGLFPIVIKVDGLAAGKGARVCKKEKDALSFLDEIDAGNFKGADGEIIVEEYIAGEEASLIAVVGKNGDYYLFPSSQDHKAVWDNDEGPNTGGMGAYSPAPAVTKEIERKVHRIIRRTIDGMTEEKIPFTGFLYVGVMIDNSGEVWVLEYNVRMGDPETQPILAKLESDFVPLIIAALDGNLGEYASKVRWNPCPAVCVVAAASGYPGKPKKGDLISGLIDAEEAGAIISFAGVEFDDKAGDLKTSGGRVLGVTALGGLEGDFAGAISRAYEAIEKISFNGMHYRKDIGAKALGRAS